MFDEIPETKRIHKIIEPFSSLHKSIDKLDKKIEILKSQRDEKIRLVESIKKELIAYLGGDYDE